ncbi:MAG: S26 family signal peptidase [Muribaculaceae bacterium]|nr:S26 family signal peptidase [Muribaculaceae bacterium]
MNLNLNNTKPIPSEKGTRSLHQRISEIKPTRWIRFGIVSVLFFLWVFWMGNPWLGLLWLILLDIYITAYIPWTWWKNSKGPVRAVMAWVDAIIYALVLVYFIFAFIGQNYKIPSSSLEKSLLVGDYLWVNKTLYGPRVPQTPLHFPLAQHTMPVINTKSYIENPQISYHRLPGIREIKRGDIVVFNYPQGDTVALKIQNPDYYQISSDLRKNGIDNPLEYMKQNKEVFGDIVWRPVDRRENYVKRAIGLPGERLEIRNDTILINGVAIPDPDNVQFNYIIPVSGTIPDEKWMEIGVRADDRGNGPITNDLSGFKFYDVPLTAEMKKTVESWPEVSGPLRKESSMGIYDLSGMFPTEADYGWTRPDMGEFWIPKRGSTLHLTLDNLPIYERAIRVYEGNDLKVKDGKIYINGQQTDYYTFKLDYYWMMGDNRDRSADSRYWGFVPEDHIVGSPMFIIASFDEERGWTDGKVRWNRILRDANPDDKW